MRNQCLLAGAIAACTLLTAFTTTEKDLAGTWRWAYVTNTNTSEQSGIGELTMGMAKEVRLELKADGTYSEQKTKAADNSVSATTGAWKVEQEGTVLQLKVRDKWRPSAIVRFVPDTLVLQMAPAMQLTMVREAK